METLTITDNRTGKRYEIPVKDGAIRVLQRGSRCWMSLPGQQKLEDVLAAIRQAGGRLVSVIPHKATLEELFLEQTNQGV